MRVVPCFVDETGALHHTDQPMLAIGLTDALYTASFNFNSRTSQKRLEVQRDIRQIHSGNASLADFQMLLAKTRHHEYKFTGINRDNLQDYVSLLNLFFSVTGSEFHSVVVERTPGALKHFDPDSWPTYVRTTKALLARRINQPSFILCDWQTRPKNQTLSLEDECGAIENVVGCVRITSETSPFLQIVDLLLGTISFDWRDARGQIADSTSSRLKRDLVIFVKKQLGMSPTTRFLAPGTSYFSRKLPMRLTVWQPDPGQIKK